MIIKIIIGDDPIRPSLTGPKRAAPTAARGAEPVPVGLAPAPPGPDWPRRAHRRPHEAAEPVAEVTSMRVGEAAQ
jgi:hypothetical protein